MKVTTFVYRLTGSGLSEAFISDGANEATLKNVSYLSDALRDLVTAIISLLQGAKRAEFSWYSEPGEYQWLLTNHKQTLSVRISWYREWEEDRRPKVQGKTIFKARFILNDVANAVLGQLAALYATLGLKGYKERWVAHEFPYDKYRQLASLVDEAETSSTSN
ncbi:MAG TPA: hypothetical protein VF812_06005 [Ktedonobacterales bacterium]